GMIPLVFMAIVLLIVTFRHWNAIKLRAVACLVAAVVLICGTDGPLFRALHVQPNPVKPYVTMFCGVGSCLNKGKTFSEETNARLEDVMSTEAWAEYYGRFVGHDNYLWGDGENSAGMDLSSFGLTESFRIYFEALFRYPDIVIKDRLDGMNIMWDVTQPDDADSFNVRVFDAVFIHSEAGLVKEGYEDGAYYYPDNPIANFYRSLVHFAVEGEDERDQVSDMLLWRSGAYLIFLLVLIIYWLKNRLGRMWWPAMPLLGNIGAMVLVLYHQSFRYIYFIQLGVLALAFMTFSMQRTLCRNKPAVPPAEDSTESE
ncbi:MAG: hypothetical protein Q4A66_07845, partial [Eubacteriales bacterium]|nr:hypothetical protein [Eubacteriales bacterium]